jgi:phage/plasmid-like protein (TIGR03299 family)
MSDVLTKFDEAREGFQRFLDARGPGGGYDVAEYGNGQFESGVFTNNEPAWHGLGIVVPDESLTIAQVLEMIPELDSDIHLRPLYYRDARGNLRELIDHKVTVRAYDDKAFAPVGRQFKPLADREAFAGMEVILDAGAKVVTAGTLKGGALTWMLAKMPSGLNIAGLPSEELDVYLLCSNSHDGNSSLSYSVTPVRVVCANSLRFSLQRTPLVWKARHTRTVQGRIIEARQALGITFRYLAEFEQQVQPLVESTWDEAEFQAFLRTLVPDPEKGKDGEERKRAQSHAESTRADITGLWHGSPNLQAEGVKSTAWAAVNAVAEFNDHYRTYRGSRSLTAPEARFRSAMMDTDGLTQRAFGLARELVTA